MSGIVVKRFALKDKYYYLSILSPESPTASEHLELPFSYFDIEGIEGASCRGLMCFYDYKGNSLICNLTTKELKFLDPPHLEPPPCLATFSDYGFGYDAISKDFKLFRTFVQHYSHPEPDKAGYHSYLGCKSYAQLYSLENDTWKEIAKPDFAIYTGSSVYIDKTGCCYWRAAIGKNFANTPDHLLGSSVLYFNFSTETFDYFSLPPLTSCDIEHRLVKCLGLLGAISFPSPHDSTYGPRPRGSHMSAFMIFVRLELSWSIFHKVDLVPHVERPLELRDDRFLYIEAKLNRKRCQLIVFDLSTNDWKKLNIYDCRRLLNVFCYDESIDPLPGAEPMRLLTETGTGIVTETEPSKDEEDD